MCLIGDPTRDLSICEMTPNPLSHTGWGEFHSLSIKDGEQTEKCARGGKKIVGVLPAARRVAVRKFVVSVISLLGKMLVTPHVQVSIPGSPTVGSEGAAVLNHGITSAQNHGQNHCPAASQQ